MKKISVLILLFSAVTLLGFAQSAPIKADSAIKADNPNAPEITFESELHDYGTMKQGADGGCEFKFKNTGKEPLVISNAKGSCGCTVPTWPKEPIMKGQTATIKVHYDTKRVGAFTKNITIESNAKNNPLMLTIKGNVEASPDAAADQGMPVKKTEGSPLEMRAK